MMYPHLLALWTWQRLRSLVCGFLADRDREAAGELLLVLAGFGGSHGCFHPSWIT
jgi:hypothetical protein